MLKGRGFFEPVRSGKNGEASETMAYSCHRILNWALALVFVVPLIPVRHARWRLAVAILSSALQIFAPFMHGHLMAKYWYRKTVSSSGGLIIELLLYISAAAVTFPIMQYYIYRWKFSIAGSDRTGNEGIPEYATYRSSGIPQDPESWFSGIRQEAVTLRNADVPGSAPGLVDHEPVRVDTVYFSPGGSKKPLPLDSEEGTDENDLVDHLESSSDSRPGEPIVVIDIADGATPVRLWMGETLPSRIRSVQEQCSETSWLVFLLLGLFLVTAYVLFDLVDERVFDEENIRMFMRLYRPSGAEKFFYWCYVILVFWGMYASVVTCAVFHKTCAEQRDGIEMTAFVLRMRGAKEAARLNIDQLVDFLRVRRNSMKGWFALHTIAFAVILLVQIRFLLNHSEVSFTGVKWQGHAQQVCVCFNDAIFTSTCVMFKFVPF